MLRNIADSIDTPAENRTLFYHFAGHDWSLLSIFGCLNFSATYNPRYGSFVIVEAYVDEDSTTTHTRRSSKRARAQNAVDSSRITLKFYKCLNPEIIDDEGNIGCSTPSIYANETSGESGSGITWTEPEQFYPEVCGGTQEYCAFDVCYFPFSISSMRSSISFRTSNLHGQTGGQKISALIGWARSAVSNGLTSISLTIC